MALAKPRNSTSTNLCCFQQFVPKLHIFKTCCSPDDKPCSRRTEIEDNRASIYIHTEQAYTVMVFS